jgi:soluble lytic murein transglycosylase
MRILAIVSMVLIILKLFLAESMALDLVKETLLCIDKKMWQDCEDIAKKSGDKALIKIVLLQKFLDVNYKKNNFENAIKFIEENPSWPRIVLLKETVEKYLSNNTNPNLIVKWFNKNPPITAQGYKFYAIASAKLEKNSQKKNSQKLAKIIKNGWVYGVFNSSEEKEYLKNFKHILCEEDYVRKIDEYLWVADANNAKKYLHYVSKPYQHNFIAQMALIKKTKSSEKLFQAISEKYYSPALLFNYLDSKKTEIPTGQAIKLLKKVKGDKIHSAQWGRLQSYYAREFIDQKDFVSSYQTISIPIVLRHEDIREAQWFSGWLALRFLHKPDLALKHFNKFMQIVKTPISVSRGQYWLARTYQVKGDKEQANKFYNLAAKYPHSFYGQLASVELSRHHLILPKKPVFTEQNTGNNEIIRAISYLIKYDKHDLAVIYAKSAIANSSNPAEITLITGIISDNCNIYHKVESAKIACQQHVFIKDYAFPTPYNKIVNKAPIESALTYSIIRQESVFNQYAISKAKAMGLMQMIEATACDTAKSINRKCHINKLTADHEYNIILGSNHLKYLLEKYDGSYLLTILAYNAGAHNVQKWLELFGDPRNLKNLHAVIDWLELVPFAETRNYAQRVLENIQVYRAILNKTNNLKLKNDLLKILPRQTRQTRQGRSKIAEHATVMRL